ncbi:MAG: hypothetical protein WCK54_18305 [Desulfuromonadales bacterium]
MNDTTEIRTPEFSSTDIELHAAIEAVAKVQTVVTLDDATGFGRFSVPYIDKVQDVINGFAAGTLLCNAKDLLVIRRHLFRKVKNLSGRG